jgi:hypothetical protein
MVGKYPNVRPTFETIGCVPRHDCSFFNIPQDIYTSYLYMLYSVSLFFPSVKMVWIIKMFVTALLRVKLTRSKHYTVFCSGGAVTRRELRFSRSAVSMPRKSRLSISILLLRSMCVYVRLRVYVFLCVLVCISVLVCVCMCVCVCVCVSCCFTKSSHITSI